ncbi:hypothetical protein DIS18_00135 [Algibacter marinivivus]|uniref:Anti-sigma-K factor rskA n=1 Tax=Algibacter marinivivus TaxID=2100723 RepID=A0A2U2X5H3_9FLAO|nr:anti-sigma factor [Algibacter marinivivus]PWH83002.1 hypothetical protein DIS18_00135 [Algibacter marinivivus]
MIKKMFLLVLAAGIFATSCSNDDDGIVTSRLNLSLDGLENLGNDFVYEGWIIVDGNPVSTGVFTVNDNGDLSETSFSISKETLDSATRFVLSIEPAIDSDPAPADTKLLVGDFTGNSANVNSAIVGDFSNAAGAFFLRSPTDEIDPGNPNNMNDQYGVWFGTPGAPPTPNFVLPTLSAGWAYEGWVVGESGPITTGVFTDFDGRDDFNLFSGDEFKMGPPIPGEDFFLNAPAGETFPLDVRGRTVVISVEPVPDNSPAPFAMKPLVGTAGQETAPATHNFGQNLGSLPTGTVTR